MSKRRDQFDDALSDVDDWASGLRIELSRLLGIPAGHDAAWWRSVTAALEVVRGESQKDTIRRLVVTTALIQTELWRLIFGLARIPWFVKTGREMTTFERKTILATLGKKGGARPEVREMIEVLLEQLMLGRIPWFFRKAEVRKLIGRQGRWLRRCDYAAADIERMRNRAGSRVHQGARVRQSDRRARARIEKLEWPVEKFPSARVDGDVNLYDGLLPAEQWKMLDEALRTFEQLRAGKA